MKRGKPYRGDRGQQFAPVPDEVDPNVFEVLDGQLGQYRCVDRAFAKRLSVLLQSEVVEPVYDVHACSPEAPLAFPLVCPEL